ncbi:MAG: hypothetical protein E7286_02050 [Lachnospiraceae bacterium]|nr:hypothetical protein [Lachnospiraceae bacterium]
MIDLHAHILPGLDDGAADIYDSLEMAEIAARNGVTAMVATPHCNVPGTYDNYYGERYIEVFQKLEQMLQREKIPLTLYAGMEVFMTPEVPELLQKQKLLTINAGHYILVEFDFGEDPRLADRMVRRVRELGLIPLIAHPERYEFIRDDMGLLKSWRSIGCETQVNKGSLQGRFGRRIFHAAHEMMQRDLVTVVASDAHSPFQRTPNMADIYEELAESYSERYLRMLFEENPLRICQDRPVLRRNGQSAREELD